jgi:hypothetical protein
LVAWPCDDSADSAYPHHGQKETPRQHAFTTENSSSHYLVVKLIFVAKVPAGHYVASIALTHACNIVQGRSYDLASPEGSYLEQVLAAVPVLQARTSVQGPITARTGSTTACCCAPMSHPGPPS